MRIPRSSFAVLLCSFIFALLTPAGGFAQTAARTIHVVADTSLSSRFSDFGSYPVINAKGDVAFSARLQAGGSGIYKFDAATSTVVTIFEDPGQDRISEVPGFSLPAITDNGDVIFQLDFETIQSGNGRQRQTIVDPIHTVPLASLSGPFPCEEPRLRSRSADANGFVAVSCVVSGGTGPGGVPIRGRGVYLGNGGALARICDVVDLGSSPANIYDACFLDGPIEVSLNSVLTGVGANALFSTLGNFLLLRGDASHFNVMLDPAVNTGALAFPNRLSHLGINSAGTVVFDAYQFIPGGYAVFKIDAAGVPVNVTDPRNFVYREAFQPSINSVGEIAFADAIRNGIFTGPDPVLDKVIAQNDIIPGYVTSGVSSSVVAVSFGHPGINTLGDLTFIAYLSDGTLVIANATRPHNHPPDVSMANQSSPERSPVLVQVTASDQDGDYPLRYALAEPGAPSGVSSIFSIDSAGFITGTPPAGTAGNSYNLRVTVTDSRSLPTSVNFTWTITAPLPPPRTNLTATANITAQGIDLAWRNPSPDNVDRISLRISSTGPGGPFVEWQFFDPATTSYRLLWDTASGRNLCFTVVGEIVLSASNLDSLNSNVACATYPLFVITGPVSPPNGGTDNVTFRVSTNMPAAMSLSPQGLPAGALYLFTPIAIGTPNTIFDVSIFNLPAASTSTNYTVTLIGDSIPVGLDATRAVQFTTSAVTGAASGPGRPPGASARRQGPLQVRIAEPPTYVPTGDHSGFTTIVVELTNRGTDVIQNLRPVDGTALDRPCIQTMESCTSATLVIHDLMISASYLLAPLSPGNSMRVTLQFPRAFAVPGGIAGNPNATLTLLLDYLSAADHDPFVMGVVLPPLPANVAIFGGAHFDRPGHLRTNVINWGPGPAVGLIMEVTFDAPVSTWELETLLSEISFSRCQPSVVTTVVRCALPDIPADRISYHVLALNLELTDPGRATSATITISSRTDDPDLSNNTVDVSLLAP